MHTGLICSRSFQNYAFKGCLSLKTMKLWLLVLTKTLFLIVLIIKLTLGNIFMKVKNPPGGATVTKKIKSNLKTLVSPLLIRSQRSQGYQKMRQDPLNMPVEVCCAKIAPKLRNIQKSPRKQGLIDIFSSILMVFWSLCPLGAILAQKENIFICRKKNLIFWHPWDPWGRVNSGKNFFGVQTATVLMF